MDTATTIAVYWTAGMLTLSLLFRIYQWRVLTKEREVAAFLASYNRQMPKDWKPTPGD